MTTAVAFHSGVAAEQIAARCYEAEGGRISAARWRSRSRASGAGEIDLVVDLPDQIVFVEVKARRRHDAGAVSARQWARIGAAAACYLAEETDGTRPCRFDLALVDRAGRLLRIENACSFDEW